MFGIIDIFFEFVDIFCEYSNCLWFFCCCIEKLWCVNVGYNIGYKIYFEVKCWLVLSDMKCVGIKKIVKVYVEINYWNKMLLIDI